MAPANFSGEAVAPPHDQKAEADLHETRQEQGGARHDSDSQRLRGPRKEGPHECQKEWIGRARGGQRMRQRVVGDQPGLVEVVSSITAAEEVARPELSEEGQA
jgi:hypothetical protein